MRKLLPTLIVTLLSVAATTTVSAQNITGTVKNQQGAGLDKTTVSLLRAKDSSVVKLGVTDASGKFTLSSDTGRFILSISHIGFLNSYSQPIQVTGADVNVGDMQMIASEGALQSVTVSSKKPLVEVKADKMILNVEGTINATGNDGLELLRKAPGVMLDKDDNISMAGKNGVQVFIDGKPSPLSGSDLANYLKTLQSLLSEPIVKF